MKQTLLEMVQSIMSDMDSDAVSSVLDTPEALQVASVIRDVYDQMLNNQIIPEKYQLDQLDTVSLVSFPLALNYLAIPSTVEEVVYVQYDIRAEPSDVAVYEEITYMTPTDFLKMVGLNLSDAGNTTQVTDPTSGVSYYVVNDQRPRFWTSLDDKYLAFDMINAVADTVQMVGTKSRIWAKTTQNDWPTDTASYDTFTPAIDDNLFPYLLAEAKSTCFVNMKQQANAKVEKQAREQHIRLQNKRFRTQAAEKSFTGNTGPNYGRR